MDSKCLINNAVSQDLTLLTIAIPTFKRFELLKETLDSVFKLKFAIPIEVIIVDNDPANGEIALQEMKDYCNCNFKYYKNNENYGMFGNWNQCLELATGKYITILHDDDLLDAEFAVQANKLLGESNPTILGFDRSILDQRSEAQKVKVPFVYEVLKKIVNRGRGQNETIRQIDISDFFWRNVFSGTLGVIMQVEMAKKIQFDANMYPIADYDFWVRWINDFGPIIYIPKVVGFYRIRENESFRPEVIKGFINKNKELREKMCRQHSIEAQMKKNIGLMRSVDEYDCNYLLRARKDFTMTWRDMAKYMYLKLMVIIQKRKTSSLWQH
jgi:glycosyltransferase involved in cell wall biosynthesis